MKYRVYRGLSDRHGNLQDFLFSKAIFSSNFAGSLLGIINSL
jgi:hypothetical protein